MMLLFSPCKRCPCPCCDAVLRSCEEALAGIILHRLPPSGLRGFVPVVRDRPCSPREPGAGTGGGGAYHGGAGGGGTESIYTSSDDPMLDAQTSGTWPSAHACLCRCMVFLSATSSAPMRHYRHPGGQRHHSDRRQLLLHPGSHPQHNRR